MSFFTSVEITAIVLFFVALAVQVFYYLFFFTRLAFAKIPSPRPAERPPVSVILAARNEVHHLKKYLPDILNQQYPDYEVVVVNHASDDETADFLKEMQHRYPHLKVITIEQDLNFFHGKKFPLSIGIKSAAHDILLLTDADCRPASPFWIRRMASQYDEQTEVVIGYGPYMRKKGFLNRLIRYDTFVVALQYLSFALAGKPYMGVGRNLSYRKSLFLKNKGFIAHYHVASGDDDLFINEVSKQENTRVELSPEAFVYSEPKTTLGEWIRQKRRHLTTGKDYKPQFKLLLGIFSSGLVLYYTGFVWLVILGMQKPLLLWLVAGGAGVRFILRAVIHKKALERLQEKGLLWFSLCWEPVHLVLMLLLGFWGLFTKPAQWK